MAVVVITRDRAHDLLRCLGRLLALPGGPRVVVVDNGSPRGVTSLVRERHPGAEVVAVPANLGAAGRNVGVRLAGREFVAFADDDSWWLPGSLEAAVAAMDADPAVGLVAGRILVGPGAVPDPTCAAMAAGPVGADLTDRPDGHRAVTGCVACAAVVRTRAFLSVGGFPEGFGVGGEEQLPVLDLWATGWRAVHVPDAVAVHFPSPSRNPARRAAVVARNDLWTAWARLPPGAAAMRTAEVLRRGPTVPTLRGAADAARRARWSLARRRAVPPPVDRARRRLSAPVPTAGPGGAQHPRPGRRPGPAASPGV